MTGICGWIGGRDLGKSTPETLAQMAGGLPSIGECRLQSRVIEKAGLCLNARSGEGHWHVDGDLCAAIEGHPRWSDARLAEIAVEQGDSAALAHAYRERHTQLLQHLHGDFAIAVLEPHTGSGLLAIDRFGINSLCYSNSTPGMVVFGSTTDSVARHPIVSSNVAPQTLYNFLYFGLTFNHLFSF